MSFTGVPSPTLQLCSRTQVKLARKTATRKLALAHYKRFMLTTKPNLKMSWTEKEMEELAAIMMQAAWRRRQVFPVSCSPVCNAYWLWEDQMIARAKLRIRILLDAVQFQTPSLLA